MLILNVVAPNEDLTKFPFCDTSLIRAVGRSKNQWQGREVIRYLLTGCVAKVVPNKDLTKFLFCDTFHIIWVLFFTD